MPSEEEIEAAKTPGGGWTKATLAKWGVAWPPAPGWKARLIAAHKKRNVSIDCGDKSPHK